MVKGTVKNFFADRGFGFIRASDRDEDYFFHVSTVPPDRQQELRPGLRVEFEPERDADGRERARRVEILDS
jgi:cold shock CspA family protein